jgi:hypothetical protein
MLMRELISVAEVPAVISLPEVDALRARVVAEGEELSPDTKAALRDLVEGYFVTDEGNRAALDALLGSLAAREGTGGAFLVRGAYGSGKTHLLGVLSLLCEAPAAWPFFLASHPEYGRVARCFGPDRPLVAVTLALDAHRGEDSVLEDLVFDAIEEALSRRGIELPLAEQSRFLELVERYVRPGREEEFAAFCRKTGAWEELRANDPRAAAALARRYLRTSGFPLAYRGSRAESFSVLREVLRDGPGVVLLLDELSLYLAGSPKRELNRDAAFLQFLAQQTRELPLWVIASLQRSLEDLGDVDTHTLRQIKDRFRTGLTLSVSEISAIIEKKLVRRLDPATYAQAVSRVYRGFARDGAGPSFGLDQLSRVYPVNPLTLSCLESLAGSLLSRTRTLVSLVQEGVAGGDGRAGLLDQPDDRLLTLDAAFDLLAAQLADLPETARTWRAYEFLDRNMARIVPGREEAGRRVAKALSLLTAAGLRWSVKELADSFLGGADRELTDAAKLTELLHCLSRRGAYVECVPRAGEGADEYFLDAGAELSELLRRRLNEVAAALGQEDDRTAASALAACDHNAFPLSGFDNPRSAPVEIGNLRRHATIVAGDPSRLDQTEIANLAAELANPRCREDGYLLLARPRRDGVGGFAAGSAEAGRFAAALLCWRPRPPSALEWDLLRDHAAAGILLADPSLRDSGRGRELRERLRERAAALKAETRELVERLYREGEVMDLEGQAVIASDHLRALGGRWEETLAAIFVRPWQLVFPGAAALAPRRRLVGGHLPGRIIEQFFAPGRLALPAAAPFEEQLRDVLEPLGLLDAESLRLRVPRSPLIRHVAELVDQLALGEGSDRVCRYADLSRALAKGEYGLTAEQCELVVAAMVRLGHLVARDAFLTPVRLTQLTTPLADSLAFLSRGDIVREADRPALRELVTGLFGAAPERLDVVAQERIWDQLLAWKAEMAAGLPRLREKQAAVLAALEQSELLWEETFRAFGAAERLLGCIEETRPAQAGLQALLGHGPFDGLAAFRRHREWLLREADTVVSAGRLLRSPELRAPTGSLLARQRDRLEALLAAGEGLVAQADGFRRGFLRFQQGYGKEYRAWHDQAHAAARFRPYVELRESTAYRLAGALSRLPLETPEPFAAIDEAVAREIAKRCSGSALPEARGERPVCPGCGLPFGEQLALLPAAGLRTRMTAVLEAQRRALAEPERASLIQRRLEMESDHALAAAVRAFLQALAADDHEAAWSAARPADVIAWLDRHLRGPVAARRRVAELARQLAGQELSKRQLFRIFLSWLDPENRLAGDDFVHVE